MFNKEANKEVKKSTENVNAETVETDEKKESVNEEKKPSKAKKIGIAIGAVATLVLGGLAACAIKGRRKSDDDYDSDYDDFCEDDDTDDAEE